MIDWDPVTLARLAGHPVGVIATVWAYRSLRELGERRPARIDWWGNATFAVGLVGEFDGVTISNPQLQRRYGGSVVPHARDEKFFHPSEEMRRASRLKHGIPLDKTVVLFFGTPEPVLELLQSQTGRGEHLDGVVVNVRGDTGALFLLSPDQVAEQGLLVPTPDGVREPQNRRVEIVLQ